MKNKLIGFLLILGLLAIYPLYRYYSHSKIFASALLNHASSLGSWSHGSISSNLDGKITIRNLTFTPEKYKQSFSIENVTILTNPMFLLKTSTEDLTYMLPETLSLSVNTAILNNDSNDITTMLRDKSMWMLMAGYAGSFGCKQGSYSSFDTSTWQEINNNDQSYNVDLFYSRQADDSLDVDLILDAENLFSTTWSSNLKSSFREEQISVDELIVDKLFYSYLDNGYNQIRNKACIENYQSSFAAYRLSSAEHIQKHLRTNYLKELPKDLINSYQRLLAPDVEYNAIITLDNRGYLSDIFNMGQTRLLENSNTEIATSANNYKPVDLIDIDYTNIDSELIMKENLKRQEQVKQFELNKQRLKRDKYKPVIYRMGGKKPRRFALKNINNAINKKVRIKTKKGRPILGYVRSVNQNSVTIESKYKSGEAILSIQRDRIASIELVK